MVEPTTGYGERRETRWSPLTREFIVEFMLMNTQGAFASEDDREELNTRNEDPCTYREHMGFTDED